MIGWFIVPPNCGCGCRMIAIGAFFCRAGWYRPSMRPAGPAKIISGIAVEPRTSGPGPRPYRIVVPRKELTEPDHSVWNYSNYMISAVPVRNTRYKGREIAGFYHDPQGKKQAFCGG